MTDKNIFTLDGNSYNLQDLDDKQKYLKNQIQDLQAKSTQLRFQLDQVSVASLPFAWVAITELIVSAPSKQALCACSISSAVLVILFSF